MNAASARWVEVAASEFPWERDALAFIREGLPDRDPYRAWANLEFITPDGTINEVDLLVVTPAGFFLVEIKSRPGEIAGDAGTWAWTHEGRTRHIDNPLILANRKAKRLKSLLDGQKAARGRKLPFLQPLVFLSAADVVCRLPDAARQHIWMRDTERRPGILNALLQGGDARRPVRIDRPTAQAVARSLAEAGIRESRGKRQVGDYILGDLIAEGPGYQDFEARHVALEHTRRRLRIYGVGGGESSVDRDVIARAARREFSLLEGIHHPGIVRAADYKEHQLGPALIYEYDAEAERLDHFLEKRRERLSIDDRLHLVRELAETLRYAHDKGLVHRALSPRSVVVANPDSRWPQPKILDWHVGFQVEASDVQTVQPTSHADALVEEEAAVYMAPEALSAPGSGVALDVFSLGAITFHVFTGKAPASSLLELAQALKEHEGLRISSALDAAPESLEELVQFATAGDLLVRTETVGDFLEGLTRVEAELTEPTDPETVSPLAAMAGDVIGEEYLVVKRLGAGSTAIALLVETSEEAQYVLKVARGPEHDPRVRDEGEVLTKLRHHGIVELHRVSTIGTRAALVLSNAGEETLGERLREQGRLPVDSLERFGDDLLDVIAFLEQEGIPHRDIKPDNLGIRPRGKDKIPHLTLFDFSLSRASPESIQAGTAPYVDPFLKLPGRQIWDLHAERFAAAVTLYQMATGVLPRWGDGASDPAVLDQEVVIDHVLLDPTLAGELSAFFERALRRDARERFDTAEEMLRAWRRVFEDAGREPTTEDGAAVDPAEVADRVALDDPLVALGTNARISDALRRTGAETVRDLLSISLLDLNRLRGVGNQTRRDALRIVQALRKRFEEEAAARASPSTQVESEVRGHSVDQIAQRLLSRSVEDSDLAASTLRVMLGLAPASPGGTWVDAREAAAQLNADERDIEAALEHARASWSRMPALRKLRNDITELIGREGGVLSLDELVASVLALRGSAFEAPLRWRHAFASTRAAIEAESAAAAPRYVVDATRAGVPLVSLDSGEVSAAARVHYARSLGAVADELAQEDPLPTPIRVIEELRRVDLVEGEELLSEARLVRLAAAASGSAAVSPRLELYPRGLPAERALKLAQGVLLAATDGLAPAELRERVRTRFPEAEALPERPALDRAVEKLDLGLTWDSDDKVYRWPSTPTSGDTSLALRRRATSLAKPTQLDVDAQQAAEVEKRLQNALDAGGFLALMVSPALAQSALEEVGRRFSDEVVNLDRVLIHYMKLYAEERGARWEAVVRADGAPAGSVDRSRLELIVAGAVPRVLEELLAIRGHVLAVQPGLLARYSQLSLIEQIRDQAGTVNGPRAFWLLLPSEEIEEAPVVNGRAVPVLASFQWLRLTRAWLENRHRAADDQAAIVEAGVRP